MYRVNFVVELGVFIYINIRQLIFILNFFLQELNVFLETGIWTINLMISPLLGITM